MRATNPTLRTLEHIAERVFKVEHGANMGPLLHVACYYGFFAALAIPDAVNNTFLRGFLWVLVVLLNYSLTIGIHHMHAHRPIFTSRACNRVLEMLLCFPSQLTAAEMSILHVHHHHLHNDGPEDVTSTLGKEGRLGAIGYWLHYGSVVKVFTARQLYGRASPRAFRRWRVTFIFDSVFCFAAAAAFVASDLERGLALYVAPMIIAHITTGYFSWLTHAPAGDRDSPNGSVNNVNNILNLFIFNQGYHAIHHRHPGIHWSDIPSKLEYMNEIEPDYVVNYWITPESSWRIVQPAKFRDPEYGRRWRRRLEARLTNNRIRARILPYFAWI